MLSQVLSLTHSISEKEDVEETREREKERVSEI